MQQVLGKGINIEQYSKMVTHVILESDFLDSDPGSPESTGVGVDFGHISHSESSLPSSIAGRKSQTSYVRSSGYSWALQLLIEYL